MFCISWFNADLLNSPIKFARQLFLCSITFSSNNQSSYRTHVNNKLSIFWGRPLIKFEDFWNRGNREHHLYEYQMLNQLNNMVDCVFVKVFFLTKPIDATCFLSVLISFRRTSLLKVLILPTYYFLIETCNINIRIVFIRCINFDRNLFNWASCFIYGLFQSCD